jgi:hypothetical protein
LNGRLIHISSRDFRAVVMVRAGRRFTMRDAIKIAGSAAVRTGELQANTRPSSGFVQVVADRDDVVGDLPVCTPSPDLDL